MSFASEIILSLDWFWCRNCRCAWSRRSTWLRLVLLYGYQLLLNYTFLCEQQLSKSTSNGKSNWSETNNCVVLLHKCLESSWVLTFWIRAWYFSHLLQCSRSTESCSRNQMWIWGLILVKILVLVSQMWSKFNFHSFRLIKVNFECFKFIKMTA